MGFEEGEWRYTCELACKNDLAIPDLRLLRFKAQASSVIEVQSHSPDDDLWVKHFQQKSVRDARLSALLPHLE